MERDLPSVVLLAQWSHWSGLGQTRAESSSRASQHLGGLLLLSQEYEQDGKWNSWDLPWNSCRVLALQAAA